MNHNKIKLLYCHHLWQKNNILSFWQVIKLASIFNLFFCININCSSLKSGSTWGHIYFFLESENYARHWRFQCMNRYGNLLGFKNKIKILQGHTSSDQIETFIFNSLRGTCPQNINSLKNEIYIKRNTNFFPSSFLKLPKKEKVSLYSFKKIDFFYLKRKNLSHYLNFSFFQNEKSPNFIISRPLISLNFHRNDISFWNLHLNLPLVYDQSNKNISFSRNKIRFYVLPFLRVLFHNKIDRNFLNLIHFPLNFQNKLNSLIKKSVLF